MGEISCQKGQICWDHKYVCVCVRRKASLSSPCCRLWSALSPCCHHHVQADWNKGHVCQGGGLGQPAQHHQSALHWTGQSGQRGKPHTCLLISITSSNSSRYELSRLKTNPPVVLFLLSSRRPTSLWQRRRSSTSWSSRPSAAPCPSSWQRPEAARARSRSARTRSPTRASTGRTSAPRRD